MTIRGFVEERDSNDAWSNSTSRADDSEDERCRSLTWASPSVGGGCSREREASAERAMCRGRRSKTYPATPSSSVLYGASPAASLRSMGSVRRSANSARACAIAPPARCTRTFCSRVGEDSAELDGVLRISTSHVIERSMLFVRRF